MAFSTVPFALQNASHSAALFRQAVGSLVPAGGGLVTLGDLAVAQTGTPSMAVTIGVGRVWIPGTNIANVAGGNFSAQAAYYAENDSTITATIGASDPTNPRIDVIYVAVEDSQYGGANNDVSTTFVQPGTAVAGATYPTNATAIPNNAIALAYVTVRAGSTSIITSDITSLHPAVIGTVPVSTYTPALTASTTNPVLGTGAQQLGNYALNGKIMNGAFFVKFGTGGSIGSGTYSISLPPGFTYNALGSAVPLGTFTASLPSGVAVSGYIALSSSVASNFIMWWQSSPTAQSAITQATGSWTNGNYMAGNFTIPVQ